MRETVDIGRRIELVPMDPHFHDITIALYRQQRDEGPAFLVHTYSRIAGGRQRIDFVVKAMEVLGGMDVTPDELLRFPCWGEHELACKRIFLEACKLDPKDKIEPRPLTILDRKSGMNMTALSLGDGVYQVTADGEGRGAERRISVIGNGLIKLGEMKPAEQSIDKVAFSCRHDHDAMVGLLLIRAPNVRVIMREQDMAASRGVLSAPSQQR
ncbi:MAG: hypothetical protein O7E52_04300 [Candidatus Poribacteria bacterium]|nr:hypothetical protein [Candidatus Poribacteria bacterium]